MLLACGFLLGAFQDIERIKYFQASTIPLVTESIRPHFVDFNDSIPNDTLYQLTSTEGFPLAYYRKIRTGLCFDNKCRLLDIMLYWNVTGRYLGFEMPEEEFLSKTDHEPFVHEEYVRLNEILANEESPLGSFTYNQLVLKPDTEEEDVDGVSSATSPAILEHVVEGAVYTTYQLWQYTYGPAAREVQKLTINALSPELILKIMESPDQSDKMWALNHINGYVNLNEPLRNSLIQMISNDNYSMAERAINAIAADELKSEALQGSLLEKFYDANYSLKKLVVQKLKAAPEVSATVKSGLADNLSALNGEILTAVLDLYKVHGINEIETYRKIGELLEMDNYYISKKVYDFLDGVEINDKKTAKMLDNYALRQGLQRN